ncbi:MAG TPA: hypothetical protein VMV71_00390 [Candidatus Paceibacterota bacterium]|nr:hypothetical protein [Candidatus Paceibacterota bacterium]
MNANGFTSELVEAFKKTTAFYRLSKGENEFVLRVLTRFKTLAVETREKAVKMLGHFPESNHERMAVVVGLFLLDPNSSLHEELSIGLHNQPRPELILEVLREIVRLTFPPNVVGYMVDVFS